MILFLDFDGVLHPQYEGQAVPVDVAFCNLSRFEAVMRDFPHVEIVISSTWREQFDLDNLRARFAPDIAARITGTTLLSCQAPPPSLVELLARREWEIANWLRALDRSGEPWIALDDAAWQFRRYHHRLVACKSDVGFDAEAASRLRAVLSGVTNCR
ncbi:HAD domain-containing protein [Rhodoferax sp.]|uniref:HAD domain-containing protein n=1 Tax=Rhodoferax sp. TaxID=50421 RepID=UPI00276BE8E2|nr:HAD domain-containing protein [Rhodoferax sp.]